ncbi:aminoglycoside 6'-N-acetyltransferase [Murinocardiopsis flavida]|uniref:Aminoglycoside 6'-N-acetyltransferase n=1 Tax=Murinocardiopsis flavida TaxID=645275 RepID=A0A2P8DLQ7_9ACTN|nr:GNAT family protein [Murinocardiopsis flavida]PSK98156.1 aminoglycoside 6'-N-acetyltransferase [Murinocardiopsis flavida]
MANSDSDPGGSAPVAALTGADFTLRRWTPDDAAALDRIVRLPDVAMWWGTEDFTAASTDSWRYVLLAAGEVRGMVQFYEEDDPDYRHAGIDVFLDPALRGRGMGVAALRLLVDWLVTERGHHRIVIDPALDNTAAVRAYEKVGFRRVGVLRRYWRDPQGRWRDGLLMDLLADDL